jgi:hypothetical protein
MFASLTLKERTLTRRVNGQAAPVMTEGNKAAHRTVLLPLDTEITEQHYADGFFAQPTESA